MTFTGSVPVGRGIAAAAVQNMTKLQMEMGSKNALAVMDDADLDLAVAHALGGAFGGTGQKCTASSRLVVHEGIHDAFVRQAGCRRAGDEGGPCARKRARRWARWSANSS